MKNITKIIWLWVLILLPLICYSADSTVEKLPPSSPASESIFYVVDKPFTSGASDNRLSLGNLLLWMATQNWTFSGTVTLPVITLADASTLTLPAAASAYEPGLFGCSSDGTCTWVDPSSLLTSVDLSSVTISGGTASRMAEWDGSGNLTSSDTATTGTGAPVKATGPTITLGENSTINNGAAPTVNAAGEVAIDTTTDQFKYYGGAARVLPYIQYLSFVIPAPAEADDINIMKAPYGMTIIGIDCIVQGTTSATGQIQECDSAGANCADLDSDIVCDADGAADDGTLTDSAIASGAWLRWKTTSLSGTPTFLTVTVRYSVVAD